MHVLNVTTLALLVQDLLKVNAYLVMLMLTNNCNKILVFAKQGIQLLQ